MPGRPTAIVLWEFSACHESAKVRRLLRQLDLTFEQRTLVAGDKSVVRRLFGSESVPILQDGDFTSSDPAAICQHIETTYGRVPV